MQDQLMMDEEGGGGGLPTGAIAAAAVAAGVIAFLIRRARRAEQARVEAPAPVEAAAVAWERVKDTDVPGKTAAATREFMMERVVPELKPILLDLLADLKAYCDQGFKRAEKAIKDF
jgi:hypothetical protein